MSWYACGGSARVMHLIVAVCTVLFRNSSRVVALPMMVMMLGRM